MVEITVDDNIFKGAVEPGLAALGISPSNAATFRGMMGRNISGTIVGDGLSIFVKQLQGMDGFGRFDRSVSFQTSGTRPPRPFRTPELLNSDRETLTLVYENVEDVDKLGASFVSGDLPTERLADIARRVAALHSSSPTEPDQTEWPPPLLPPWGRNAVHIELLEGATSGYLDVWRIIQGDNELRLALHDLVAGDYDPVPVHGDLRMDQFLSAGEDIWMIDWEEFRMGDPARDIGSLCGELLYAKMRRLTEREDGSSPLTESEVVRNGAALIQDARTDISIFWNAYHSADLKDEVVLAGRTAQYVGWQLFDRALAAGSYVGRISPFDRAVAGIGRNLILNGPSYSPVVGLERVAS